MLLRYWKTQRIKKKKKNPNSQPRNCGAFLMCIWIKLSILKALN